MKIQFQAGAPIRQVQPLIQPSLSPPRFAGDTHSPLTQGSFQELKTQVRRIYWDLKNLFAHHNGPKTPVNDVVFTVFDLETTGLNPKHDAITEICALKFKNGKVIDRFSTLVNPGQPIPKEVQELTGIRPWMLRRAPDSHTALTDLARFVGKNPVLVGHYVNFDIEMIREKLAQHGLKKYQDRFWQEKAFCTKTLGQLVVPDLPNYSGVPLAEHLGIINDNPHRAESDVIMTGQMLYTLWQKMPSEVKTLAELTRFQGPVIRDYSAKPLKLLNNSGKAP